MTALAATCRAAGYRLRPRLAIYSSYIDRPGFLAPALQPRVGALAAALAGDGGGMTNLSDHGANEAVR